MTVKLVIFDWDGTVMDSVDKIVTSIQYAAQTAHLPVPSAQAAKDIIGLSITPALTQLFGHLSPLQLEHITRSYKEKYVALDKEPTPLFKGIIEVFDVLSQRGVHLAIATGKSRQGLERLLAQTGVGHYFCDTMTADDAPSKPHPQMIAEIVTRQQVSNEQVIMIGDSILDLSMANNAGVKSIGVSYGAHDKDRLERLNPIAVVDCAIELLDFIPH